MKSDVIIIGGGAAGLMAAIGAARTFSQSENGGTVTVLEKMPKPGRKIMITGKGRCNFTNVKSWEDFSAHIRTDANFLSPSWHNLTPENLISLMKEFGMNSVVERGDRAFPASHNAGDVVDTLKRGCTMLGVKIVPGCEVKSIARTPRGYSLECIRTTVKEFKNPEIKKEVLVEHESYSCSKLIIATGGLSYPGTGSTGDGLKWAREAGHEIEPLFPSLTALVPEGYKSDSSTGDSIRHAFHGRERRTVFGNRREVKINPLPEDYPKFEKHIERIIPLSDLGTLFDGNMLENVRADLFIDGKLAQSEFGDIEFTDGGIEGPVGFQISRKAVKAMINGSSVSVTLDLKPAVEESDLKEDILARWKEVLDDPRSEGQDFKRLFRILLGKLIPWNLTLAFLKTNPKVSVESMASMLKNWSFPIAGFVGFERCVVTAGGISTGSIVSKTLESKLSQGLYFCGEVLDIDADTGGYNLHLAFSTGYLAGMSAAKN